MRAVCGPCVLVLLCRMCLCTCGSPVACVAALAQPVCGLGMQAGRGACLHRLFSAVMAATGCTDLRPRHCLAAVTVTLLPQLNVLLHNTTTA